MPAEEVALPDVLLTSLHERQVRGIILVDIRSE